MSITSNSHESPQINSQALIQLKRALEGTEASLLYVKRKLDELAKNWELTHSCPDSRHVSTGFDWVRQLELAFSMISESKVKVENYFSEHCKQGTISVSFEAWDRPTVVRAADLIYQAFEELIVQAGSRSTPHNKIGVA